MHLRIGVKPPGISKILYLNSFLIKQFEKYIKLVNSDTIWQLLGLKFSAIYINRVTRIIKHNKHHKINPLHICYRNNKG